jgi:O-glycosyl hydrolase
MKALKQRVPRWALYGVAGIAAASVTIVIAAAYQLLPGSAVIAIDPSQRFQVFRGWEATDQAGLDDTPSADYADELLDGALDLGLTRLRVEVQSSMEHRRDLFAENKDGRLGDREYRCLRYTTENDNDDPQRLDLGGFRLDRLDRNMRTIVLPLRDRLQQQGEKLWINVNYVAFTDQICGEFRYVHNRPDEYAEFVLAIYQYLRDRHGVTPDSWEVMLEPDNTRVWTARTMANAMDRAASRLIASGFTPAFIAPSTTSAANAVNYFDEIWKTESVRPFLRELSYHRYDGPSERTLSGIDAAARKRSVETSMLEWMGATHEHLYQDLTSGGVSAWQQYTLGFPAGDSGGHYFIIEPEAPPGRRVRLSQSARYLRQYFRAIRPGAQRLGASSDNSSFKPVAFESPTGRLAVVVSASRGGQLTIQRLNPGPYRVSCWTDASREEDASTQCDRNVQVLGDGTLTIEIPSAGVLSLVQHAAPLP